MNPPRRHPKAALVFLVDVDETLFDDGRLLADLRRHLRKEVGREGDLRYWQILQRLHRSLGYPDYLGALQQYRQSYPHDPHVLTLSSFLIKYHFAKCHVHKEEQLKDIELCYPANHYVVIDDNLRILSAIKKTWGVR